MPQHKVQAGETLSGIASRYKVSLDAIKAENPIIRDVNHIEAGWDLAVPESPAAKRPLPAALSANDDSSDDLECSDCAMECVALVQLTEEDEQVFALTETQFKALEEETTLLNEPLAELAEAEKGDPDKIPEAREKAWNKLRDLGALPKPEKSTTAADLLAEYEAKWKRERERLEHQRRRKKRIDYEIRNVRQQILIPGQQQNFTAPKDRLSLQFFTLYCGELETTRDLVNDKIQAHEEAVQGFEQDLTRMDERLKLLRAALEAEIDCRVAEQSGKPRPEVTRLRLDADELKEATLWPSYISEPDIEDLVSKTRRFRELDAELLPYMDYVIEYSAKVSPAVWLATVVADDIVEDHAKRQEERRSLMVAIEKKLRELVDTSTPVDRIARPQYSPMKRHPLVEIKHTGTGGYRYMRREVVDQLRRHWKPLKTSDVRAAMSGGEFKRAWGDVRQALKTSKTLALKFGEWKSKDDNFFNRLEMELLKKEASTKDGRFSASAEAQMFRFAAQCGLKAAYDPDKKEAYIGGKLEGAYSLMQGEAVLKAQLPNEQGSELVLKYESVDGNQPELHCGYFRADAEYRIRGFAGACASLAAKAKVSSAPGEVGVSGETNGEAFAGATLNNEATFGVKWKAAYQEVENRQSAGKESADNNAASDDQIALGKEYRSLLDVKPEFALSAGIGAGLDFKVFLYNSKLYFAMKGYLIAGPGGGGGVAAELNGRQVWELVKFVRWSLEQSDFRFLDWIDSAAFEYISFLQKMFSMSTNSFVKVFDEGYDDLMDALKIWSDRQEVVSRAIKGVLANEELEALTPLAKAELLHILAPHCHEQSAALAALRILDTVKTHRELVEVLKRMGAEGRKGSVQTLMTNYYRLVRRGLFRSPYAERSHRWLEAVLVT
jgi:LysM repeat protein